MSMALGISPLCPTKVQSWRWAAARREGGIAQLGALAIPTVRGPAAIPCSAADGTMLGVIPVQPLPIIYGKVVVRSLWLTHHTVLGVDKQGIC